MAATKRPKASAPPSDGALALRLFDQVLPELSWSPWRSWLSTIFALPPENAESAAFAKHCIGRDVLPKQPARECWCVVGRRGGKSRVAALVAVFAACFRKYTLSAGERGRVLIIASDRRQATVVHGYIVSMLEAIPALASLITRQTADVIDLANSITIEIATANFRSLRGYTTVCVCADEVGFWESDSNNPAEEVLTAIRPSMATVANGLLLCLSTPYARRGALWSAYSKHYGQDSDVTGTLVWKATSLEMHPDLDARVIDRAFADDRTAAESEYNSEFRSDLASLFSDAVVRAAIVSHRFELPYGAGITHRIFTDPGGGSSDGFPLCVSHRDSTGRVIIDLLREVKPPFDPSTVVAEYAAICKQYHTTTICGDMYAGLWPTAEFQKHGIRYVASTLTRSQLYLELLPLLNAGRIELLDDPQTAGQLIGLDRKTGASGKDSVDHRAGQHDDRANCLAGAAWLAVASRGVKEAWPLEFTSCAKAGEITSFSPSRCGLLGGPERPSGSACFARCAGYTSCREQWNQFQRDGGEHSLADWSRKHFEANDFVSRFIMDRWVQNCWQV